MILSRAAPALLASCCLLVGMTDSLHGQGGRSAQEATAEGADFWPQWRGPQMTGIALSGDPPTRWSETKNVRWKVEIPGRGSSTPIVWGDTIYLQAALFSGMKKASRQKLEEWQRDGSDVFDGLPYIAGTRSQRFVLLAIDRATGEIRWQSALREQQPHEGIHPTNTWASASPVTDGERIVAFFGSRGLYCLDTEGRVLWEKDLGDMDTRNGWGEGASPFLYRDRVLVNWDHEGESFLAAFDLESGDELWRAPRDEPSSWFTPLVVEHRGRAQVLTSGSNRTRGYDLDSGESIWNGPGLTLLNIPTPIVQDGVAYLTAGYRGNLLLAVDLGRARGRIDDTDAILWSRDRDTPYVASPLLYHGALYVLKHLRGILTVLDAATGDPLYGPVRLPNLGMMYASPVAAEGRIYLADREGITLVLEHGPKLEVLATNELDDGFDASPAIVGKELYLRGRRFLYRISR